MIINQTLNDDKWRSRKNNCCPPINPIQEIDSQKICSHKEELEKKKIKHELAKRKS